MSEAERKARAAERARERRARERADREAVHAVALESAGETVTREMSDALEMSLAAARWLTATDSASVAQARGLAGRIDYAATVTDYVTWSRLQGPFLRVLGSLGLTAVSREAREWRSRKAEIVRAESAPAKADNVTTMRPPKTRLPRG